jgi:DNA segregation ATPase FtsK/SpoIIIE, S-DNA-T family
MSIWAKLKARKRLINAFRSGGIHLTVGEPERHIFPKIHHVSINNQSTSLTFTLPNGLDPKLLEKNFFAVQQHFGKDVKLDGEIKRFILTIQHRKLAAKVAYNYAEILAIIEAGGLYMPIVAGKDSTGKLHVYDATNNPNLLIYGQPGSGKSSILHVILTTLMQLYSPEEIEFYMADFKQSELNLYEGVAHVKSISYVVKDFAPALTHLKKELTKRGELLREHKIRHMNKLPKDKKPPYTVLCVDEFVMINDDDIMADLLQIASLGRACGIYLILSMQRPSHKILSTDVRGVLSVRMGFRTVDKRNALIGETPGSEKISKDEPGKFLLNLDELTELKAPYLDEEQTEKIIEPFKKDDWRNHNYKYDREVASEQFDATTSTPPITEKDVFNDVIN